MVAISKDEYLIKLFYSLGIFTKLSHMRFNNNMIDFWFEKKMSTLNAFRLVFGQNVMTTEIALVYQS